MKLTGILKNKVDKAETMAEKKDLIAEAGMELNDNELEMVAGGAVLSDKNMTWEEYKNKLFDEWDMLEDRLDRKDYKSDEECIMIQNRMEQIKGELVSGSDVFYDP